ncbi:MAG: hypothetical protein RIR09_3078 [Pseudomonadota bacterium]
METLPQMMIGGLEQLLDMGGLGDDAIKRAVAHYHTGAFAKADSRSDLGSLNDLMLRYQWIIEREGGLAHCDLTRIIMATNDMPQRRLDWSSSWDVTRSKLQLPL